MKNTFFLQKATLEKFDQKWVILLEIQESNTLAPEISIQIQEVFAESEA